MAIVANAIRNLCEFTQDSQISDSPNWIRIKHNLIHKELLRIRSVLASHVPSQKVSKEGGRKER